MQQSIGEPPLGDIHLNSEYHSSICDACIQYGLDIMGGPACPIPVANNSKKDSFKLKH